MLDFNKVRKNMVDCQIRTCDVTSHTLLEAFLEVPRERFVSQEREELAYIDEDVALGGGRYMMEPAPFAKLAQAVAIKPEDLVLDIGCATGYSSAIFSRMASMVIALEEDAQLAETAAQTLEALDYDNVAVVQSQLNQGYAVEGPYDVIFIGGAISSVPKVIFDQLKDGGKLIAVEGVGNAASAKLYLRHGADISGRYLFNCAVEPLPGFESVPEFAL